MSFEPIEYHRTIVPFTLHNRRATVADGVPLRVQRKVYRADGYIRSCFSTTRPIEPDRAKVFPFTSLTVGFAPSSPLQCSQREPGVDKHVISGISCTSSSFPYFPFLPPNERPHTNRTTPETWTTILICLIFRTRLCVILATRRCSWSGFISQTQELMVKWNTKAGVRRQQLSLTAVPTNKPFAAISIANKRPGE